MTTEAYAASGRAPRMALQSGPMLLIDGRIHPAFRQVSDSLKRRSGIGVDDQGRIAIICTEPSAEGAINFHSFARLFQHHGCRNALFLDGGLSHTYVAAEDLEPPQTADFAAILGVVEEMEE